MHRPSPCLVEKELLVVIRGRRFELGWCVSVSGEEGEEKWQMVGDCRSWGSW